MGFKETLGKMIGIEEADETITVEEIEREKAKPALKIYNKFFIRYTFLIQL